MNVSEQVYCYATGHGIALSSELGPLTSYVHRRLYVWTAADPKTSGGQVLTLRIMHYALYVRS